MLELRTIEDWKAASLSLSEQECFPELTARLRMVSPEWSDSALQTRAVMERAFAEGWVQPKPPAVRTGRTVAIVGGGMMGLAAATALNTAGHFVRVYESSPHLGGLLCVGRGRVRIEQWVIDRRVQILESEGVEFVTGAHVGEVIRFDELRAVSDSMLLAVGHRRPRPIMVPSCDRSSVMTLEQLLHSGSIPNELRGKKALILGDAEGVERAQAYLASEGVLEVVVMPHIGGALQAQLDHQAEGGCPLFCHRSDGHPNPVGLVGIDKASSGLEMVRCVLLDIAQDPFGSAMVVPRPGSAFSMTADLVVIAPGYFGPDNRLVEAQLGVELDVHGNVAADRRFGTSVPGVFYAGDANPRASSLLWDLSQGLEVAATIDVRLGGKGTSIDSPT